MLNHDHHAHAHAHDHHAAAGHSNLTETVNAVVEAVANTTAAALEAVANTTTAALDAVVHDHAGHAGHNHDHHAPVTSEAPPVNLNPVASHDHDHHDHDHQGHQVPQLQLDDPGSHHGHHGMDHSGHNMKMYFHGGFSEVILFDCWRINSHLGLLMSCLVIFALGACYEGLKWFRIYLQLRHTRRQRHAASVRMSVAKKEHVNSGNGCTLPVHTKEALLAHEADKVYATTIETVEDTDSDGDRFFAWDQSKKATLFERNRILQAALYCTQITLAYLLMLIAMTYNTYLTAAVVLGAGFGHWLFAAIDERSKHHLPEASEAMASDACH